MSYYLPAVTRLHSVYTTNLQLYYCLPTFLIFCIFQPMAKVNLLYFCSEVLTNPPILYIVIINYNNIPKPGWVVCGRRVKGTDYNIYYNIACIYDDGGRCCKGVKTVMWATVVERGVDEGDDDAYSWRRRRRWSACVRVVSEFCRQALADIIYNGYIAILLLFLRRSVPSPSLLATTPNFNRGIYLYTAYSVSADTTAAIYFPLRWLYAQEVWNLLKTPGSIWTDIRLEPQYNKFLGDQNRKRSYRYLVRCVVV